MDWLGQIKLTLKGLNVERFINYALKKGIEFRSLKRDGSEMTISVDYNKYKKTIKMAKAFEIEKVEYTGLAGVCKFFLSHIGVIVGLVLGLAMLFFSLTRVWRIDVIGLERIDKQSIIEILNEMDYNIGSSNFHIDNKQIEDRLLEEFEDISMVSVIHEGCSIIISLKEKEYEVELDPTFQVPIIAGFDGIIESIDVVQGTPLVKVGDVVSKGDILIAPFTVDSEGNMIKMRAIGDVKASVYVKGSVTYKQGQERLVRSGNVQVLKSLKLFGTEFPSNKKVEYEYYEVEKTESNLSNNFLLPFKVIEERYYEMVKVVDNKTFEEQKDYLIKKSIYEAYENLDASFEVSEEQTDITEVEGTYFITTYLKVLTNIADYEGE